MIIYVANDESSGLASTPTPQIHMFLLNSDPQVPVKTRLLGRAGTNQLLFVLVCLRWRISTGFSLSNH